MDLTSSSTASPTTTTPNPTVQPIRPSHLQLGTNSEVTLQQLDERQTIDRTYGLDCSIQSNRNISIDHRLHHPQLYRLCTGGLLTGDIIHAIMDIQNTMRPNVCFKHMDNYVRDPTHSNIPSTRLIKELFSAQLVGLLHNHNGLHWGLSLMLHKGQRLHVLYLDSLNNRYPDLDHDLQLFWNRTAQAAQQLHLLPGHAPRTVIHHLDLPCQTNNYDCGIFVLAYQRAVKAWINTHLPSAQTSLDQRINTLTATLRQVTQHTATALRIQLRTSLAPHCKVQLRAPSAFSCSTINDACACLTRFSTEPIAIDNPSQITTDNDQPSQLDEPKTPPSTTPGPPDDTDSPTPAMLVQLQQELAALPALLQSSTPSTAESAESPAHAPPTLPTDPTEHPNSNTAPSWQSRPYPVTTPSNSSSPRWQQLIQDPTELDILSYSTGLSTDFQAGTLNIGGSLRERITDIAYAFAATQLDYLCLQDTRQTKREGLAIASTIRELLPPGTLILQAPISKPRPSDPPLLEAKW